ncbi:Reverse transcriptase domain-containing protein [Aphis craccivora]|uniref:Reverse transcriptase domain-containing protein n=1 Tax=Aphis craccivora TaxID=307492 RepID=A0A6G0ZBJ4_APHCR|nr:Reverse transcriptase domain-containing protein [Aphis craccivora]
MDPRTSYWRRKFNQELKEELNMVTINGFIKSQRIKWLVHVMRRNTDEVGNQEKKRPRGRPRKRWLDVVKKRFGRFRSAELEVDSTGSRQVERFSDGGKNSWRVMKAGRRRRRKRHFIS